MSFYSVRSNKRNQIVPSNEFSIWHSGKGRKLWEGHCKSGIQNRPVSQIPQCTSPVSHNASFCNRNVHISVTKWCIVEYLMHCGVCEMGLFNECSMITSNHSSLLPVTFVTCPYQCIYATKPILLYCHRFI